MNDNAADLVRLEAWLGGLMAGFSPSQRAKATRAIASLVRARQAQRIAAQKNPDGSRFAPRKPSRPLERRNRALKFLYPAGGSGAPRVVLLKSWARVGPLYNGYDIEAGGQRSFEKDKIVKWLKATPDEQNKREGRLRQRPTIKSRMMFRKLRRYTFLKAGSDPDQAWAGFDGVAAQIARVHQEGAFDRPTSKSPLIRYDRRELIGLTDAEEQEVFNLLFRMVNNT